MTTPASAPPTPARATPPSPVRAAPSSPAWAAPPGAAAEQRNQELLARINATRRVHLSSTRIHDRHVLRLCIISHRTHADRVHEALAIIHAATG